MEKKGKGSFVRMRSPVLGDCKIHKRDKGSGVFSFFFTCRKGEEDSHHVIDSRNPGFLKALKDLEERLK